MPFGNHIPPLHPLLVERKVKQHGPTPINAIGVPQLLKFWSDVIVPLAHTKRQKASIESLSSTASKIEAIKLVHANGVSREIVEDLPAPEHQVSGSDRFLTKCILQILVGIYPPILSKSAPHVPGVVSGHPKAKRLGVYIVSFANSRFVSENEAHQLAEQINAAIPKLKRVTLQIEIRHVEDSLHQVINKFTMPKNVAIAGQTMVWMKDHPVMMEYLPKVLGTMLDKIQSQYNFYEDIYLDARYVPLRPQKISHQEEWDLVSRSAESVMAKHRETFSSLLPSIEITRRLYPDMDLNPTKKERARYLPINWAVDHVPATRAPEAGKYIRSLLLL